MMKPVQLALWEELQEELEEFINTPEEDRLERNFEDEPEHNEQYDEDWYNGFTDQERL